MKKNTFLVGVTTCLLSFNVINAMDSKEKSKDVFDDIVVEKTTMDKTKQSDVLSPGITLMHQQEKALENNEKLPWMLIEKIIKDRLAKGISPEKILIAFDFDGTLNTREGLRGKEETFKMLHQLSKIGIKFVVVTAAKVDGMGSIFTSVQRRQIDDIFSLDPKHAAKPGMWTRNSLDTSSAKIMPDNPDDEIVYISGNIITGSSGYNKPMYLSEFIARTGGDYDTVVFLDDSSFNCVDMYESLRIMLLSKKKELGETVNIQTIFVPRLAKAYGEPGQEENEIKIQEILKKQ